MMAAAACPWGSPARRLRTPLAIAAGSSASARCMTSPARPPISWLMPLAPTESPQALASTLACLQHQTLQADELVIAADGPLPTSLQAVIEACRLPMQLHLRPRNCGIGATLAAIAPCCRGEILVRIDSDDFYSPQHTHVVVNGVLANPHLGVVGSQLLELDTDHGGRRSARRTPTDPGEARRWLLWRNPLNHQTVAIRREALIAAGGYRHTPAFEDWDLWLRMAAAGYELQSLPTCTVAARVNERHRRRRRGWRYAWLELRFFSRQVRQGTIAPLPATLACLCRLPWRLLPAALLGAWMRSRLRGSPAVDTAWVTELLAQTPGEALEGNQQQRQAEQQRPAIATGDQSQLGMDHPGADIPR